MEKSEAVILFLDDVKIVRDAVRLVLPPTATLREFGDPRDAIAFLRHHQVDAILTDLSMPHLPCDGRWFIAEVRKLDQNVAIVVNTADHNCAVSDFAPYHPIDILVKGRGYPEALLDTVERAVAITAEKRAESAGRLRDHNLSIN